MLLTTDHCQGFASKPVLERRERLAQIISLIDGE
jgi:hypothetical protein